jgi:hypothetical protein
MKILSKILCGVGIHWPWSNWSAWRQHPEKKGWQIRDCDDCGHPQVRRIF